MQAVCQLCGTRHVLDDRQVGAHPLVRFRCTQCGQSNDVEVAQDTNRTTLSFLKADAAPFIEPTLISQQTDLGLPADKRIQLEVVTGKSQGLRFPVERPRVIIGRLGADLAVDDPEVSRWHCAVEVHGEEIRLRDLDSRNGVYMGEERVHSAELRHASEFRIGATSVRLNITPR
jgi:hypothetical protein